MTLEYRGRDPCLGRRIRYISPDPDAAAASGSNRWYEIVGVVDDLFANTRSGTIYHPAAPGQIHPVTLALRVGPDASGVAGRLRELTTALDVTLRLDEVRTLDEIYRQHQEGNYLGASALAVVTPSVLLLPAAAAFMIVIGLLAAAGPARRGLRVEPTEALRGGGLQARGTRAPSRPRSRGPSRYPG